MRKMPRPIPMPLLDEKVSSQNSSRFKTPFKNPNSQGFMISVDKIHAINSQSSPSSQLSDATVINPLCHQPETNTGSGGRVNECQWSPYASATYGSSLEKALGSYSQDKYRQNDPLIEEVSNETDKMMSFGNTKSLEEMFDEDMDFGKTADSDPYAYLSDDNTNGAVAKSPRKDPKKRGLPVITKTYTRKPGKRVFKTGKRMDFKDSQESSEIFSKKKRETEMPKPVVLKLKNKLRLIALIEAFAKDFRKVKKRYDLLKAKREASMRANRKREIHPSNNLKFDLGLSPKKIQRSMTSSQTQMANGDDEGNIHFMEE